MKSQSLKSLLGRNVREFRGNLGFSMEYFAERAKISTSYLGAIERGEKWPGAETIERIARGLGAAPSDLMKSDDSCPPDIKAVAIEMVKEIESVVNKSMNKMNTAIEDLDKS